MLKRIILWIWCFPQMVAGTFVKWTSGAMLLWDDMYVYRWSGGSVSLGEYIFFTPSHWPNERIRQHEEGHRKQSRILGWLYLPVIGVPSFIWANCFEGYRKRKNVSYYSFYTEWWADKLGGVGTWK
jgi:hypothetical protein